MVADLAAGRLAGIELLSGMAPAELAAVEQSCVWRRFGSGEQILDRNSQSRDVFFVVDGRVQIVNYSFSGREVAYASVSAGGFFGELSAIDGEPRSASAVAAEKCLLAAMAPDPFNSLLQRNPKIAMQVMRRLARIVRTCDDRIMDLSTLGAVQRVHVELLRMAKPDPITKGLFIVYPLPKQQEIAGAASTTRETVARVLSQLQSVGLIRRKEKSLYILDRAELERLTARLNPQVTDAVR